MGCGSSKGNVIKSSSTNAMDNTNNTVPIIPDHKISYTHSIEQINTIDNNINSSENAKSKQNTSEQPSDPDELPDIDTKRNFKKYHAHTASVPQDSRRVSRNKENNIISPRILHLTESTSDCNIAISNRLADSMDSIEYIHQLANGEI